MTGKRLVVTVGLRKITQVDEGTGLENQEVRQLARGFESLIFRQCFTAG